MGKKKAAAPAAAATNPSHVYKASPLLAKPGKRSRQDALPSALHMGVCVALSLLVFAIINICVSEHLGHRNPFTRLVQSGTMMAMITITVLGTPNLGNSFTKALGRIVGVMVGGWLFFGLYAACQQWWFLVICLTIWAFVLVASSFFLTGREFLFPVALVTAFIVVCNFNSVKQALVMTLVKTIAFTGAIIVYTIISLMMFPLTATQQLLTHLAIALRDLQLLAEMVLITGGNQAAEPPADNLLTDAKDVEAQAPPGTDGSQQAPAGVAVKEAGRKGKAKKLTGLQGNQAANLAADSNNHLQMVQQLLRMTRKERYIGTFGSYKCFLPTVFRNAGKLPEEEVLAVVVNASQVLRVLTTILSGFGALPLGKRSPPPKIGSAGAKLVLPLAEQAVGALQDISDGLPVSGPCSHPVPIANLHGFSDTLQQLVTATLQYNSSAADISVPSARTDNPNATRSAAPQQVLAEAGTAGAAAAVGGGGTDGQPAGLAPSAASRWKAAAVAGGAALPLVNSQKIAADFSSLLSTSVSSEEGQVARWCSVLVLSRELGRSIAGLNDSVNEMLVKLPWLGAGAVK